MANKLQDFERAYRALADELAAELATVGFIGQGSVVSRYTSCGKPGCRCVADPPRRHGPYYQWSRALRGKTVTRRLNEHQAELYRDWIANHKRLETIIAQMMKVSVEAGDILLGENGTDQPGAK